MQIMNEDRATERGIKKRLQMNDKEWKNERTTENKQIKKE